MHYLRLLFYCREIVKIIVATCSETLNRMAFCERCSTGLRSVLLCLRDNKVYSWRDFVVIAFDSKFVENNEFSNF